MKAKHIAIIPLILSIFLTGCFDRHEIDETAYIVALGIDNSSGGNFAYTFQFSKPLAIVGDSDSGSSEGSGEEPSSKDSEKGNSTVSTLTISAPDFYIAKNMTNNFLSKTVDMSHLKLIVFSAKVDALALENHSRLLLKERRVRPHTAIAVAADSASEYLEKVNPELEANTSKHYELMSLRSNNVYAPSKCLHDFVDQLSAGTGDTVLPIAINGEMQTDFPSRTQTPDWVSSDSARIPSKQSVLYGMALFKNKRLVQALSGDDALIFNILNRNIRSCTVTFRNKYHPNETFSLRMVIPEKMSARADLSKKEILISQDLNLQYQGGALPKGYRSTDELFDHARQVITRRISDFFTLISRTEGTDILNLKNCTRKDFSTWEQWNSFDWDSFYKTARFVISINVFREV